MPRIANAEAGPEVEITPEMIEAGALALSEHDLELESSAEGAIRVFQAMIALWPGRRPSSSRLGD
jgi:hypothetical protein